MEVFYQSYKKDKGSVKCEDVAGGSKESKSNPKKCSITFNETVRLDYEFADRAERTMFPIDEKTNEKIRTFYYDDGSHLLHSVTLSDQQQCRTYNLTANQSLNWFYLQDMFVRRPELFYTRGNYSYLRDFTSDDVECQVFERKISYMNPNSYQAFWGSIDPKTKNSTVTNRPKNNSVPTEHNKVIATHYYPKDSRYWENNPNQLSIPKKIELTVFNSYSLAYSELIINVRFNATAEEIKKYDATKCIDMDKR